VVVTLVFIVQHIKYAQCSMCCVDTSIHLSNLLPVDIVSMHRRSSSKQLSLDCILRTLFFALNMEQISYCTCSSVVCMPVCSNTSPMLVAAHVVPSSGVAVTDLASFVPAANTLIYVKGEHNLGHVSPY